MDTGPEVRLRSRLHGQGLRFRKDYRFKAGEVWVRPDIIFTRRRLAVFVDGCYWHGCPEHGRVPRKNVEYWTAKLARNRERDRLVTAALEAAEWRVLRFWEHEAVDAAAEQVVLAVAARE